MNTTATIPITPYTTNIPDKPITSEKNEKMSLKYDENYLQIHFI